MAKPLVYCLIINWNGIEHLPDCFESLIRSTYQNVKFLLLDNGSSDSSIEFIKKEYGNYPQVEILAFGKNLGWSGANNAGINYAVLRNADYVFLLNNDTKTHPDAISCLVDVAETNPKMGALAPKLLFYSHPELINSIGLECSVIGAAWDRGIGRLNDTRWNESCPVIGVCGAGWFLRSQVLKHVGLLAEDFGIYFDDLDLCWRIWNAGYEIWTCPEAVVYHKFSATMGSPEQEKRKYYLNTRNRFRFMLRNFPAEKLGCIVTKSIYGEVKAVGRAAWDREFWKIMAHIRSWLEIPMYLRKALKHRRSAVTTGNKTGAPWDLVRDEPLFFQGFELPEDGWYRARQMSQDLVRPISRNATMKVGHGRLRVISLNCYPHLGAVDIEILLNSVPKARLRTQGRDEIVLETIPGVLTFSAQRIFFAEETGEKSDFGGWLAIQSIE
ncbi:MAG TPA: glycosyltransferase family 2 protein [Candidatus Hydrogenedentes bacterium]|nr:glycosyltransferase family 2 protein [Candidatus Hydrogenedentota bacterium]HOL75530.1 glycosyltransferase family 2 protein [Candidatus Hydrogenedentota bacterium]HPO86028.1 glycosyltransferase family 2 protein [Candidatus Hydrogenedentota bacterium]